MLRKRGLAVAGMRRDLPAHRASRRYFMRMLSKWLRHVPRVAEPDGRRRRAEA